jgi:hypothetical protein
MAEGVNHRGFSVPKDKFLYLTEDQAKVHNKDNEQRVAKVETPPKKDDVAVLADFDEYQESFSNNTNSEAKKPETVDNKEDAGLEETDRGFHVGFDTIQNLAVGISGVHVGCSPSVCMRPSYSQPVRTSTENEGTS